MPFEPSPDNILSSDRILSALRERAMMDEADVPRLLGVNRSNSSVEDTQLVLLRDGLLSRGALAELLAELTCLPAYTAGLAGLDAALPAWEATTLRCLLLAGGAGVAFVEPTAQGYEALTGALGRDPGPVHVIGADDFAELRTSLYTPAVASVGEPECPDIYALLDVALGHRASDIHLQVGVPPKVRRDGSLTPLAFQPLSRAWLANAVRTLTPPHLMATIDTAMSADFAYAFGATRFRINAALDTRGYTMALRVLPSTMPTLDDLDVPPVVRTWAHKERGLILVTGQTGSGKSTTLAALLGGMISTSHRHIITLEDPVEFRLPTGNCLVNQRELGTSFASFSGGLRDALRQDPDVVLVGEMRDAETIRTAFQAAETGHLVLSTLHTYNAAGTIMRLVNSFPANEQDAIRAQLSQMLIGIVSQTLLPRTTGGRVAAFEVLVNNDAIANNLRKADGQNQITQAMEGSSHLGMQLMEAALAKLVAAASVRKDEAEFRARDKTMFERSLRHLTTHSRAGF